MNTSQEEFLVAMRARLSFEIDQLQKACDMRPDNGAELTLALRHLQDARMRLGVAITLARGENPWESKSNWENQ